MDTSNHRVIHTKLGLGRRLAIPASLCQQYGLAPGEPLIIESVPEGILVKPLEHVIDEVQAYFVNLAPSEKVLSDELLKERREEEAGEPRV